MGLDGPKGEPGFMGDSGIPGGPGLTGEKGLPGAPGIRVSIFILSYPKTQQRLKATINFFK